MALTITFELGTDLDQAQVLVQNRVSDRRAASAGRGAPPRHHHGEEFARPDDGRAYAVARRYLRPALRLELCAHPRPRRAAAARRRRRRAYLRRARIFAAHLARPGKAVGLWHDRGRRRRRRCASRTCRSPAARSARRRRATEPAFQYTVTTQGRFEDAREFRYVIVKSTERRPADLSCRTWRASNSAPGTTSPIPISTASRRWRSASSSGRAPTRCGAADEIQDTMKRLSADFPQGLAYEIVYNPTEFIAESINEVYKTIGEAILLVVIVIIVFLQSLAHGDRSDRRDPGLADRHAGGALCLRLLAQHADAVRAGAGGRHRRRRRHRRGGECRAKHRDRPVPEAQPRTAPWTKSAPPCWPSRWC